MGAILSLIAGLVLLGVGEIEKFRVVIEVILVAVGIMLVAVGAINLFLAHGLWTGKGWVWTWTLITNILALVLGAITAARGHFWNIISLLMHVLVIVYLNTTRVKTYFGKP